jgi:hypothetical protein
MITSYSDLLAKQNKLNSIIIKQVNPAGRKIFGNTQFNTQIILSNKNSRTEADRIAKYHNLTLFIDNDCVSKLKEKYHIDDDLLIVKTEEAMLDNNDKLQNRMSVLYYNLNTRVGLDKSICQEVNTSMMIPITLTANERETYTKYKQQGIDIFSPTGLQNRNRCVSYSSAVVELDNVTNSIRNITEFCISSDCLYTTLTEDNYINCNCGTIENKVETDEFTIMSCFSEVGVRYS